MSVEFFYCHFCRQSVCDCGFYTSCNCGRRWCDEDCAQSEGYINVEEPQISSCKFCREEDLEDYQIVSFLLNYCHLSRRDVVRMWRKNANSSE